MKLKGRCVVQKYPSAEFECGGHIPLGAQPKMWHLATTLGKSAQLSLSVLSFCWYAGDWMFCTSIITIYLGLQSISAYGLVGIAVTRYISIREPLLFNMRVTHWRALTATVTLWVVLFLASAVLYFRLTPDGKHPRSVGSSAITR